MLWNLFLMLAWAALMNNFSLENLVVGFVLGFLILSMLSKRGVVAGGRYVERTRRAIGFVFFYLYELVNANITMAIDVLKPQMTTTPAIVALQLEKEINTDAEITLLSNLITLTPGTMAIDLSKDRRTLYVHTFHLPDGDAAAFSAKLKREMERRVLEVLH
jgi:multicomponent Na+:H+ antiporter subunit E